jgi:hypothetical protein
MKPNFILNHFDKLIVVFLVVLILLSFRNPTTVENSQQQSTSGKYQAIFACQDKSGINIFLILNSETGKFEYRVAFDETNDRQKIRNLLTDEIINLK